MIDVILLIGTVVLMAGIIKLIWLARRSRRVSSNSNVRRRAF